MATTAGLWNTVQWALADLGVGQLHLGNVTAANDLFDRAAAASRQVGDGAGEVLATYGRALVAQVHEDWSTARGGYEAAMAGFAVLGTPVPKGLSLAGLGRCDEADGDLESAFGRFEQSLAAGRTVGEPGLVATSLEGLARLTWAGGEQDEAGRLLGEAARVRESSARPAPPHERRDMAALLPLLTS